MLHRHPHAIDSYPHLRYSGIVPTSEERSALVSAKQFNEMKRDEIQEKIEDIGRQAIGGGQSGPYHIATANRRSGERPLTIVTNSSRGATHHLLSRHAMDIRRPP